MVRRFVKIVAIMLITTMLMLFSATTVLAFDTRSDDTVHIPGGEVINDDLYTGANTITIDGTVNGDIWAAARIISIGGIVDNSVMAIAQTINISGDIGHAVRVAGETINISGNIAGDLFVVGNEITIADNVHIKGDLLFGAGVIRINGIVDGDIKGRGGEIIIGCKVGGDLNLEVSELTILPTADIKGSLTYIGEERATIQPGAQISGITTHKLPESKEEQSETFLLALLSSIKTKFIGFLMALLAGLLIILIAPKRLASIAESISSRPGPSAGWGALVLLVTPIAAVIICITIIGLPVGLIALALWGIAIYLAQIPVGLFLGQWIISHFRDVEDNRGIMIGALATGLIIVKLLSLIPYFGFFIGLAVILFGLGAVIATIRRQKPEAS
jgi:cytoskeletal protein CcmA (bactofilin family)